MTEVPEHLLQRAAEARARLTGEGAAPAADTGAEAAPVAAAAATPAPVTPAAPAVPEEPKAPEPVAPYVEAGLARKVLPVWIIPVLLFLPIWAIYYVGYLERPPAEAAGLLAEGGEVYSVSCAGCHGGTGGGGTGRQLNDGEILLTFPSAEAGGYDGVAGHIAWTANGTAGTQANGNLTYGDPDRAGGAHEPGSFGGAQMAGFGSLGPEELVAVVYYERVTHGGLDAEAAEAELHLLEEVVHLMEEAGIDLDAGVTVAQIQEIVDEAHALTGEGGGETAAG